MKFQKYHALGNDYIVLFAGDMMPDALSSTLIRTICRRHTGLGADGILLGPIDSDRASRNEPCDFGLRIFNPDGSEAEKSGNGLRIFARALWDRGLVSTEPFTVETLGGNV